MTEPGKAAPAAPGRAMPLADPRFRSIFFQTVLIVTVLAAGYVAVINADANLRAQRIATGLGFLDHPAGFGINQTLIAYSEADSYGRVFVVGLLNTLLVSVIGIVLATIVGFVVGIARLSSNWLIARAAGAYVEVMRNLPLLFQILFWYLAVLGTLPSPRQSLSIADSIFISNRGIIVPSFAFGDGAEIVLAALMLGIGATAALGMLSRHRRRATGRPLTLWWAAVLLLVGLPLAVLAATDFPIGIERPVLRGFNFVGGVRMLPEFAALLIALVTYTGAFIAEIVRAGILSVHRSQTEAAYALGLTRGLALRLIVVPQALRLIVPPLTSQYLNLTKNSSLAVAIGYPDLFAVFAGTTLNQTGQAIEIIAITMAIYLLLSLTTSALMNWYNARMRLAER
ncbi:MAG: ABC transporter permease subunit [Rhizobiales bacterium]|nr:ABC transporter permease subunit [Hyphomicrobiales bacterium]